MAVGPTLGQLTRIDARSVWKNEATEFTPWLAANISLLGDALGLDLEVSATEVDVGQFSVDIVATDLSTGHLVVIENQLDPTDHSHLGQLITYAAGQTASSLVWVAPRFRDEHRQALDWLNANTAEDLNFFGVEVELLQVDGSVPAPHFKLVAQPNEWAKAQKSVSSAPSELGLRYQQFLSSVLERFKQLRPFFTSASRVSTDNWFQFAAGRAGFNFSWSIAGGSRMRVELYIDVGDRDQNKAYFDQLQGRAEELEANIGHSLTWERLDGKKGCRIAIYRDTDPENFESDPDLIEWAAQTMVNLADVLRPIVKAL